MKLWLLRHARVRVQAGICYGASEVEVDPSATRLAAQRFASNPISGCTIWTSPAARAQQLATALVEQRKDLQQPKIDPRLREMDFGQWELRPWSEIPQSAMEAWTTDFAHHRFGGNDSTQAVIDRVAQAMDAALKQNVPEMIWVTHAGVIRATEFLLSTGRRTICSTSEWPISAPAMGDWLSVKLNPNTVSSLVHPRG